MDLRPLTFLVGYGRGTRALAAGLERAGLMVRSFERFATALTDVVRIQPELILVGDTQTESSPIQFLIDLRERNVGGIRLFLSHSTNPRFVSEVLEAGAHDVVGPPHSVGSVLLRRHVQLRLRQMHPAPHANGDSKPLTVGDVTVDPITHEVSGGPDESFTLTGRELDVLVRLMEARGDVVPREALLSEIWGEDQENEAVLDTTVHRLRKRLEEEISRPDLVATVRGVGYRLRKRG